MSFITSVVSDTANPIKDFFVGLFASPKPIEVKKKWF